MGYLGDRFVKATPGEIVNEAGFSASLWDVCEGGKIDLGGVTDHLEGKEVHMACPCLFYQLCSEKRVFFVAEVWAP